MPGMCPQHVRPNVGDIHGIYMLMEYIYIYPQHIHLSVAVFVCICPQDELHKKTSPKISMEDMAIETLQFAGQNYVEL